MKKTLLIGVLSIFAVAVIGIFASAANAEAAAMKVRDGSLVKTANSPTVYIVVNDGKRLALNMEWSILQYHTVGGNPEVMTISSNDLSRLQSIGTYTAPEDGSGLHRLINRYKGLFFKYTDNDAIYYKGATNRRNPFPSMEVLNSYNSQNIFLYHNFQSYPTGSAMKVRDGSLIKGFGPAVYIVVNNGKKIGLNMSWETLVNGLTLGNAQGPTITTVSNTELSRYKRAGSALRSLGTQLNHYTGVFMLELTGIGYYNDSGRENNASCVQRRPFPSMQVLNSYSPQNIFIF